MLTTVNCHVVPGQAGRLIRRCSTSIIPDPRADSASALMPVLANRAGGTTSDAGRLRRPRHASPSLWLCSAPVSGGATRQPGDKCEQSLHPGGLAPAGYPHRPCGTARGSAPDPGSPAGGPVPRFYRSRPSSGECCRVTSRPVVRYSRWTRPDRAGGRYRPHPHHS